MLFLGHSKPGLPINWGQLGILLPNLNNQNLYARKSTFVKLQSQVLCLGWGGLWGHLILNFEPLCGVNELTFWGTLWLIWYLAMVVDG